MSTVTQPTAYHEVEPVQQARSTVVGSRLMLAANTSVQLSFLFGYLYLRANNFDGMWRNGAVAPPPPGIPTIIAQVLQVLIVVVVALALRSLVRRANAAAISAPLLVALLLILVSIGVRVFQLTHTNWSPTWDPPQGSYVDISVLWLAVIAAEVAVGFLWTVKVLTNRNLRAPECTVADLRAVQEFWLFVAGASILVTLLVQFVI